MKVLHLNEHLAWAGGVETYLLSLIPELNARGHEQVMVYARGRADLVADSHCLPELSCADRASEASAEVAMRELLERIQPDIVHLHQVYNTGAVRACLDRVPVLVHGHDYRYLCPASTFYYRRTREVCGRTAGPGCFPTTLAKHCMTPRPRYALDYYRRVKWFEREAGLFSGVIAPSEASRQRFLSAGFSPDKVWTAPYFYSLPVRERTRPIPGQKTMTFLGRIAPNKGMDIFVRALAKLPPDVRGLAVGNFTAESQRRFQRLAEKLNCGNRLELRPWAARDEVVNLFEETTVFVFPSLWPETLGIVGLEALANGVPVVASGIGGTDEWCIEGETGLRVPPNDHEALAEAVRRLMDNPALLHEFGQKGMELIGQKFSVSVHLDRLQGIYRKALDNAHHRSAAS